MTTRPTLPGTYRSPNDPKTGLQIDLVIMQPVQWRGAWALLRHTPTCWCGRSMPVRVGPFLIRMGDDGKDKPSADFHWDCEEHGNADLVVYYFEQTMPNGSLFIGAYSAWEITAAPAEGAE